MSYKPTVGNKLFETIMQLKKGDAEIMDGIFQAAFARSNGEEDDWGLHNLIDGEIICVADEVLKESQ